MKKMLLALCLASLATPAFAQDIPEFDIKAHCKQIADQAGGSSQLELHCRKSEAEAQKRVARLQSSAKSMKHCTEIAEFSGGSYALFEHCLISEAKAEKELAQ